MSLRIETKLVADGRRLASRAIVLQSLQSIPCYAFRKVILPIPDSEIAERQHETWGGLGFASDFDEHAFEYQDLGHCMIVMEQFMGGAVHDGNQFVDMAEIAVSGQIEPYYPNLTKSERIKQMPDWTPKKGDIFCLLIGENNYTYLECVGRTGSSMMGDFGVKYAFNQKLDLDFLPQFDENNIVDRTPLE